jgi:hypothetical protein
MRVLDFRAEGNRKRSVVVRRGWSLDLVPRGQPPAVPNLGNLYLSADTIVENSAAGTVVGAILGRTPSSTLILTDSAGGRFAIDGANIVASATSTDFESAASHQITIRETLAGSANSPRDTVITITVTNVLEQPSLSALSLSASVLAEGSGPGTVVGVLLGKTGGSTLALVDSAGGRFAVSGNNLVAGATSTDFETSASHSVTVRETLADSPNSPRDTVLSVTVSNVFEQPALSALTLSSSTATVGTSTSISINGPTPGSTLAGAVPDGMVLNSALRMITGTPTVAGTYNFTLTETLSDSANSPRVSNVAITVAASSGASADFYMADSGTGDGLSPATPGNFATVWAAASDGKTIKLVGDTTVPSSHVWNKSVTLFADKGSADADPLGDGLPLANCRFTRPMKLKFSPPSAKGTISTANACISSVPAGKTLTLKDGIKLVFEYWPSSGQTWDQYNLSTVSGAPSAKPLIAGMDYASGIVIDGAEVFHGYGPTFLPYDPTVKLPEFQSPAKFRIDAATGQTIEDAAGSYTGWGDPVTTNYNTPFYGPLVLGGSWGLVDVKNGYFHDFREFSKLNISTTGVVHIRDNWFERSIGDFVRTQIASGSGQFTGTFKFERNIVLDVIGNARDAGNPHSDATQLYAMTAVAGNDANNPFKIIRPEANNNFYGISRKGSRAQLQTHFWQASDSHQQTDKALVDQGIVRNNVAIGLGYKMFYADASRDMYIRNNIGILPSWWAPPDGANICEIRVDRTYTTYAVSYPDSEALVSDTIAELITGNATIKADNNLTTGLQGAGIAHSTIFTDPSDPGSGVFSPHALFEKYKPLAAHATKGPQFASLRALLSHNGDFTGEKPHIGPIDQIGVAAATVTTSNMFVIHGGDPGDTLPFVNASGLEWRTLEPSDRTTVITDWNSSNANVPVGKLMQFRMSSAAAGSSVTKTVSLGGVNFDWRLDSVTAFSYAQVLLDPGTPDTFGPASSQTLAASAGTLGTLALMRFRMDGKPTANITLFGSSAGTPKVLAQILTTGQIRISLAGASGSAFARVESNFTGARAGDGLCDNVDHDILISWDTSQADQALGRSLYVDGSDANVSGATWAAGTVGYATAINAYRIGNVGAGGRDLMLGAFILRCTERVDLTDGAKRALFAADYLKDGGLGPFSARPAFLLTGTAGQAGGWNDATTGMNWGTGFKFKPLTTSAAADVTGSAWS